MWLDVRAATRFLVKRRAATAVAVLTLGVGVAVATLALGTLDGAFWREVRSSDGSALFTFYKTRASAPQFQTLSYSEYTELRDRLKDEVDAAAFFRTENTLGGGEWPTRVRGELVSANYFRVLGARPFAGEWLPAGETPPPPPSTTESPSFLSPSCISR